MFSKAQKLVLNRDLTICNDCDHLRLLESQISSSLKRVLLRQMFSVNSSRAAWETFVFAFEEHPQGSCRDTGVGTSTSISPHMRYGQNMCRCYVINKTGRFIAQNTSLRNTYTLKSITVLFVAYVMTLSLSENVECRTKQRVG